jgi:cold shock CspA family protein
MPTVTGSIERERGGDVCVHRSAIQIMGVTTLRVRTASGFEVQADRKEWDAANSTKSG